MGTQVGLPDDIANINRVVRYRKWRGCLPSAGGGRDEVPDSRLVGIGGGEGDELVLGVVGDLEYDVVELELVEDRVA